MDRANLDRWCERGMLGLTLAILAFGPLAAGAVGGLEFLVIQGLTLAVVLLWIARIWIQESYRVLWPPICWFVVAFTAYAIVRYQFAEIEYAARGELIRVLTYAFLFFAILNNLHRQEPTQTIVFAVVFLGMAISLYAVYQFITDTPYVWHLLTPELKPVQYMKRASGTYICPNNFAGVLEMLVPLGLAFTLKGRFRPTTKVFLGYASVAMLAGIGVSVSRGGWFATGLALVVFFALLVRYRDSRLPAIAFLVLLIGLAVAFVKQGYQPQKRWQKMFSESGEVFDERFYIWRSAIDVWKENPWFGVGPAHFDDRFPKYRPAIIQMRPGRAHNDYLNTLADWGLIGVALVAGAWTALLCGIVRTWRFVQRSGEFVAKPSNRAAFVLGGATGLLGILVHSLTDFNMHIPANAILAVSLMAMLSGYLRFATERYWVTTGYVTRLALTVMALAGTGYLAQQGCRCLTEQLWLRRANQTERWVRQQTMAWKDIQDKAAASLEGQAGQGFDWARVDRLSLEIREGISKELDLLKLAFEAEPKNWETAYRIGETLRKQSWQGGADFRDLAEEAMKWFERGIRLNPFSPYNYLRFGMCLDWLDRNSEGGEYIRRAVALDPKNHYIVAHLGWHFFRLKDYPEAKRWLEESLRMSDWRMNPIAVSYLELIKRELERPNP